MRLSLVEKEDEVPSADNMIKQLVQGQEAVTGAACRRFPLLDKVSDEPTTDLLTQRMQVHEKAAWLMPGARMAACLMSFVPFPCCLPFLREFLLIM
jgi:DNA-binding ferritin-like protein